MLEDVDIASGSSLIKFLYACEKVVEIEKKILLEKGSHGAIYAVPAAIATNEDVLIVLPFDSSCSNIVD